MDNMNSNFYLKHIPLRTIIVKIYNNSIVIRKNNDKIIPYKNNMNVEIFKYCHL